MQFIRNLLLVTKPLSPLKSKRSTKTNLITRQLTYIFPSSFPILISTISKTLNWEYSDSSSRSWKSWLNRMSYKANMAIIIDFWYCVRDPINAIIMNFNGLMAVGLHAGVSLGIFTLINQAQPTAYMDEIFHIPQARKYCYGKFREVVRLLLIIPYW